MPDFAAARKNMVDCQIQPSGVIHAGLLNAFGTIPREQFIPANMRGVAYTDELIHLPAGRLLLEPAVHARMLQSADPAPGEKALDIGGGMGYSAMILGRLVKNVVAVETPDYMKQAQNLWREQGATNIQGHVGELKQGAPALGPYDVIFINGAAEVIPQAIAEQLTPSGRLVIILQKPGAPMGQAMLVRRSGDNGFSAYPLFETGCSFMAGFEPETSFNF